MLHLMPPHEDNPVSEGEAKKLSYRVVNSPHVANLDAPEFVGSPSGDFNVLAVGLDFEDKPFTIEARAIDDLMFLPADSVNHYFRNQSLGSLEMMGPDRSSVISILRMPHPYSYYVQGNYGFGTYPNNTQGLAEDAARELWALSIDFKPYDNNGDGYVDGLVIVHPGSGAELTGNKNDIWSHKWSFPALDVGGVKVSAFCMQPEFWQTPGDMTIGVYCHEIGHLLGLPDLYDTDNSSRGVGRHCLMATGSWNGRLGSIPAGMSAYCRVKLGFLEPTDLSPWSLDGPMVFRPNEIFSYPAAPGATLDYYLLEYRDRTGYNAKIPGTGLQILRISDHAQGNSREWVPGGDPSKTYQVAVMQADHRWELERNRNYGDPSDFYPSFMGSVEGQGVWNRDFAPETEPSSRWYDGTNTELVIRNIELAEDGTHVTAELGGGIKRYSAEFVWGMFQAMFKGGSYNPDYDVNKDGAPDSVDLGLAIDMMTDTEKIKLYKMFQPKG